MDRRMDGQTTMHNYDKLMDGWVDIQWMDGWMEGWMSGWVGAYNNV